MSNIINKRIRNGLILSLSILVILTFGLITIPVETNAYDTGYQLRTKLSSSNSKPTVYNDRPIIDSLNPNPVVLGSGRTSIVVNGQNFVYGAVAKLNGSDRTTTFFNENRIEFELIDTDTSFLGSYVVTVDNPGPGGGLSNGYVLNIRNELAIVRTVSTAGSVAGASTNKPSTTKTAKPTEDFSDLTANAIFGTDTFMPSGLIQWLILAIFILIIIILARKFFGLEDKYHATPLKQS
ncbi:hypothetical protein A3C67_03280 [Candidatus Nomurabacteria bacterium RIFCSPHIGHO2_02_FULL_42_19]|uniref:IPT/TIG domain-containing protein n=1 Tax=Candidatus Nomurabacteria bacterium RIFCSPHIGHO2_02_FULL_42_19 TaxID=1801756 RepID=A0A1F6W327_9BACT|nr:MAG: hypothetical protein A3C67_03280 [Candidatus Nomurabacteria bacterium RIFCSPHIGHO2_02_FULL_42_19]